MTHIRTTARKNPLSALVLAALVTVGLAFWAVAAAQEGSTQNQGDATQPGAAQAGAAQAGAAQATPITHLMVKNSAEYGDYLTDNTGRAIYMFTSDKNGVSTCTGDCATNWQPVIVKQDTDLASLVEGTDLNASLLGTLTRDDGTYQLTYNGWPLYYYAADQAAGAVGGQGMNDVWYLVSPKGTGVGVDASKVGGAEAPR